MGPMSDGKPAQTPPNPAAQQAEKAKLRKGKPVVKKVPVQKKGGKQAPEKQESQGGLEKVVVRNEFYRDGYRSLLSIAVMEALIIVGLIGIMFFVVKIHQPENRYFATTEDGRLIPMLPLSEPNLSEPALMSWAAQAATEVMTFGFHDYRRRLQESSRNFTPQGWESFTAALENSRYIETIEANRQVLTAAPLGAPILQAAGLVDGRYQWVIEIPMIFSFEAGSKSRNDRMVVTLVVVRVPRLESASGIGISQWLQHPG